MASTHIRFDWAIKRLLRQKANFGILEGFLSELLKQDVEIQEILESESNKETEEEKFNRVDILARLDGGELVIIEVQNEREHDYFHRMNFSQAKLISQYMYESAKYKAVKRIISVNIVYFELGQGTDYIYEGQTEFKGLNRHDTLCLNGAQRKLFPDLRAVSDIFARYFIIKVNTFDDIAKNTLDEWIYFLKNSEIRDDFKAKGLKEAKEKMRKDNLSGYDKEVYENFVKIQRIKEGEIESAKVEVEMLLDAANEKINEIHIKLESLSVENEKISAENERALRNEAKVKETLYVLVKKLHKRGFSLGEIAEDTGLTIPEIKIILE